MFSFHCSGFFSQSEDKQFKLKSISALLYASIWPVMDGLPVQVGPPRILLKLHPNLLLFAARDLHLEDGQVD